MSYNLVRRGIEGKWHLLSSLTMLFFVTACTHALPSKTPIKELSEYVQRAERAKAEAGVFAQQAKQDRERAEMLLYEAKAQLAQAKLAAGQCAQMLRKIPKARKAPLITARPKGLGDVEVKKEPGAVIEEKRVEAPPYSPSDAPLKK